MSNVRALQVVNEYKEESGKILNMAPDDVLDMLVAPYLDAHSVGNLSSCSSSFYHRTKQLFYWQNNLIAIGCSNESIKKIIQSDKIKDYKKLYKTLSFLAETSPQNNVKNKNLQLWELYCMSGEPAAIKYVFRCGMVRTFGWGGLNIFHYVALSGSVDAMHYVARTVKSVRIDSLDSSGRNILHFAAWSDSVEMVGFIRSLIAERNLQLKELDYSERGFSSYAKSAAIKEALVAPIEHMSAHLPSSLKP